MSKLTVSEVRIGLSLSEEFDAFVDNKLARFEKGFGGTLGPEIVQSFGDHLANAIE